MTEEFRLLTYDEIASTFGISRESARRLTIRKRWNRRAGNDGKARIAVPAEEFETRADTPVDTSQGTANGAGHDTPEDRDEDRDTSRVAEALEGQISLLREMLQKAEEHAVVGWTRADEERSRADEERSRADRERDRANAERDKAEAIAAKLAVVRANGAEQVAGFERNMAELRVLVDGLQRSWWRRLARG